MGVLAWLLATAAAGSAAVAFAVSAPEQAWWLLGLAVAALLAGPHILQWWLSRAARTERLAARWWDAGPGPVEMAFLCGGPDRVVDLVITDLVAEGRVALDDDGRLAAVRLESAADDDFRRQIGDRLGYGNSDVSTLRFSTRSVVDMPALWRSAVRQGLMLPAWRREYTHGYVAGAIAVTGFAVAVAFSRFRPEDGLTFGTVVATILLAVVALQRPRSLVGYEFDPRTAAGLRAAELAFLADRPGDRRHRIAVTGIRSRGDLGGRGDDRLELAPSHWHIPWYARRVREESAPWWREVAQATTDYAEPEPGTSPG